LADEGALEHVANFAQELMTNVGAADLLRRVDTIRSGRARKKPNEVEAAAIRFSKAPSFDRVADLLVEINKDAGVRAHRPTVLSACLRA